RTNVNRTAILETVVDAGDKTSVESRTPPADSGRAIFTSKTSNASADIDITIARNVRTGGIAHSRVVVASHVAEKRVPTKAVIKEAGCLVKERLKTESLAGVAGRGVVNERLEADVHVVVTEVASKRALANGHVPVASLVCVQAESTYRSVGEAGSV